MTGICKACGLRFYAADATAAGGPDVARLMVGQMLFDHCNREHARIVTGVSPVLRLVVGWVGLCLGDGVPAAVCLGGATLEAARDALQAQLSAFFSGERPIRLSLTGEPAANFAVGCNAVSLSKGTCSLTYGHKGGHDWADPDGTLSAAGSALMGHTAAARE